MPPQTLEGTWEEIVQHASELAGHRVRVTVLEVVTADPQPKATSELPPGTSLADALKEYIGKYASDEPCDDGRRAEELWGEYVMEKDRKRRERRS